MLKITSIDYCSFTFLLLQKSNKKGAPKTITPRFREAALIRHLYYCRLSSSSLIIGKILNNRIIHFAIFELFKSKSGLLTFNSTYWSASAGSVTNMLGI